MEEVTRNELLSLLITESHVHPDRGEWPVCVGIHHGEFTVLSSLQTAAEIQAYFITAIPQSEL